MRLVRFHSSNPADIKAVRVGPDGATREVPGSVEGIYAFAMRATDEGMTIPAIFEDTGAADPILYDSVWETERMLPPILHPDPAPFFVTCTAMFGRVAGMAYSATRLTEPCSARFVFQP